METMEVDTEVDLDEEESPAPRVCRWIAFGKSWELATKHFPNMFFNHEFGQAYHVFDRLRCQKDVKTVTIKIVSLLKRESIVKFGLCCYCCTHFARNILP